VVDAGATTTFVVGADVGARATSFTPWAPGAAGVGFRLDVPEPLPLPVLVGAHLTRGRQRSFVVVDPGLDPADCEEIGADLAAAADRVALLVMGDGAARHDVKAPGYVDPRAAEFDQSVHEAFAAGDPAALAALDPRLADELMAVGRAPWQVLAGAARDAEPVDCHASVTVPYGVGYHVVTWR
jgi:hypothetical protein